MSQSEFDVNTEPNPDQMNSQDVGVNNPSEAEHMDQDITNGIHSSSSVPVAAAATSETGDDDSDTSEFEANDQQGFFELWSSDATSPDEDESEETSGEFSPRRERNWSETVKKQNIQSLKFTGESGIRGLDTDRKYSALECFRLFVDDDLIKLMVTETNKNARANFIRYGYHAGFLAGWLDVDFKEMTQFIGLIIFMAFKRLPETTSYWSTDRIYFNSVACRVLTQTRFHRILAFWHFGTDGTDGVFSKVNPVVDRLNANFCKYKEPSTILYVGRSTVYLRNKYIFKTRLIGVPKKGSKLLRLMDQDVYTYKLKILVPNGCQPDETTRDVMELLEGYMDKGRLIIFHNLWVPLDLADKLLKRKCHSIGMLRKNARGTPKELLKRKVGSGELVGYQDPDGLSVFKWKQMGMPCYGVTTCHTLETVPVNKKSSKSSVNRSPSPPPVEESVAKYLRDYSLSERIFDAQEKFSVNTSPLNEQVKWYQRIACDVIVNTATINALVIYRKLNKEKIKMWDFRDKLFRELVDIKQLPNISSDEETEEPDLEE